MAHTLVPIEPMIKGNCSKTATFMPQLGISRGKTFITGEKSPFQMLTSFTEL